MGENQPQSIMVYSQVKYIYIALFRI